MSVTNLSVTDVQSDEETTLWYQLLQLKLVKLTIN